MSKEQVNTDDMLGIKQLADKLGISQKALRVRISKGKFPQPNARKGDKLFWNSPLVLATRTLVKDTADSTIPW